MKTILAAMALGLVLACVAPAQPVGPAPLLDRIVSADEDVREAALEEWEELEGEPRFRLALEGLRSDRPEIALFCADRIDPWRLNLEELRRRAALMARHAGRYFLPDGEGSDEILVGLGAPEIPALLRGFAKLRIDDPDRFRNDTRWLPWLRSTFQQIHREMSGDHVPVLVSLLDAEDPVVFRELLSLLNAMALYADGPREPVARGFLYGIARIEAEKAGRDPASLESCVVDRPASGLPVAFLAIARRAFFPEPWPQGGHPGPDWFNPGLIWTLRWARELTAGEPDVAFLLEVAGRCEELGPRAWAVEALAGLGDPRARRFVAETAAGAAKLAPFAAAALARRGDPASLATILARPEPGKHAGALALEHAPDLLAESAWWIGAKDLSELEAEFGIRIPAARLVRAARRAIRGRDWIGLPESFGEYVQDEDLRALVDRIVAGKRPLWASEELRPSFGVLEVRVPEHLGRLLAAEIEIREHADGWEDPEFALRLLACVGDDRHVDEILARLPELLAVDDSLGATAVGLDLGGLNDERLAEALKTRARADDPAVAMPALFALAVRAGVDRRMLPVDLFDDPDFKQGPWSRFRTRVLAGDPIGGLVEVRATVPNDTLPWLGLSRDPRVLALFQRLRSERRRYWPATAGLALAGDAEARAELLAFLRDNRTVLLDDLNDLYLPAMEADPAALDLVIERVGENCCAACHALWALCMRYPTLDTGYEIWDLLETRRRVRAWYDRHRERLVWSRIAGGYIPR